MALTIEKLDHHGRGIAHLDGKIIFVENALPSEEVEIKTTKQTAKYDEAIVSDYIAKSPLRAKSRCSYYEQCGGCHLRHMSYEDTVKFKKNKLSEILNKYAGLDTSIEVIKNKNRDFYRNKIELHIEEGICGFYKKGSREIVEVDRCLNAEEAINVVMRSIDFFHLKNATMTVKCNYDGEIMIDILSDEEAKIDIEILRNKVKLVGIIYNGESLFGSDHYIEKVGDLLFKESYNSFFQVNRYITEKLFEILRENITLNSVVLDMCCGVGTLSLVAASKAKKVYGIEIVENSIKDAIVNAHMNKIENVEFIQGDAFTTASEIEEEIDTVIVDPPRSGLSKEGVENIMSMEPDKIIYISCDPITLSRDLSELKTKYDIQKVYLLDMFSYTYHLESVCVLRLR